MRELVDLPPSFAHLRTLFPGCEPTLLAEIVRAVLGDDREDRSPKESALLAEVEELAHTMADARAEIAALQADDITGSQIPSATDELDAIVAHTATATNSILECCERLDELSPTLAGPAAQVVQDVTMRVYEACSFQDITGQRITKVVATLQAIERQVAHIIANFSRGRPASAPRPVQPKPSASVTDPASLLNGPQLPASAMGQSDIDALLASFE